MEYNTTENAEGDVHAFLNCAVASILPETFTAHMAITLTEEEMAVGLPPPAHLLSIRSLVRLLTTGAFATFMAVIGFASCGYPFACS
jgi:type IV secretory pathway VirB2 component (pilin)